MTHCTVCGAEAREGAKFCTSCGARLVDTVTTVSEPVDTAPVAVEEPVAEPADLAVPAESSGEQPDSDSRWGPIETGDAATEAESVPVEPAEPEATSAEPAEYVASWPDAEAGDEIAETPGDEAPDDETPDSPEDTWSSWADTTAVDATAEEPAELAEPPIATPDDAEPVPADPMDEGHHGASQWESWAPSATGAATVPASGGDVGASVRRLLDDLANRIDRLIDPAPVAARGVDADELADQLDRWSNASTDAEGLLEVVRAVRTSPRDVDALTRLADRAPDLELLVRHYQSITSDSGAWSQKLRDQRSSNAEDA